MGEHLDINRLRDREKKKLSAPAPAQNVKRGIGGSRFGLRPASVSP